MTFLKKLGQFLAKAVQIATGVGPIVLPFIGSGRAGEIAQTSINDLTQLSQIVTMMEAVLQTPGSGADKLAAATPLALQVLRSSQAFAGKHVANETLAEQGASKIVSGLADFMNSLDPNSVQQA